MNGDCCPVGAAPVVVELVDCDLDINRATADPVDTVKLLRRATPFMTLRNINLVAGGGAMVSGGV